MVTTRFREDVLASEWSRTACPTCRARPTRSALVRIQAPVGVGGVNGLRGQGGAEMLGRGDP